MLNSSRRAETNCYYFPLLCKFYEGQVQSHMALPLISQDLHTLQHFGAAHTPTLHRESSAWRFPPERATALSSAIFITDPIGGAACSSFISANRGQPCPGPQHQQRCRGILQWKNPAPLATPKLSPQCQGSAAPLSPSPSESELELLLTKSGYAHEYV